MTSPTTITAPVPAAPPAEEHTFLTSPTTITAPVPAAPPAEEHLS
jgi:hypothetical protein